MLAYHRLLRAYRFLSMGSERPWRNGIHTLRCFREEVLQIPGIQSKGQSDYRFKRVVHSTWGEDLNKKDLANTIQEAQDWTDEELLGIIQNSGFLHIESFLMPWSKETLLQQEGRRPGIGIQPPRSLPQCIEAMEHLLERTNALRTEERHWRSSPLRFQLLALTLKIQKLGESLFLPPDWKVQSATLEDLVYYLSRGKTRRSVDRYASRFLKTLERSP